MASVRNNHAGDVATVAQLKWRVSDKPPPDFESAATTRYS
jgi:hypothetical protein